MKGYLTLRLMPPLSKFGEGHKLCIAFCYRCNYGTPVNEDVIGSKGTRVWVLDAKTRVKYERSLSTSLYEDVKQRVLPQYVLPFLYASVSIISLTLIREVPNISSVKSVNYYHM